MVECEIQSYIKKQTDLQASLLEYIEGEMNLEEKFQNFSYLISFNEILKDRNEFIETIQLLVAISCNHHRSPTFFEKIENFLLSIKDEIHQHLTNQEIFKIFNKNKRILLFLVEQKILDPNSIKFDVKIDPEKKVDLLLYMYPEFKKLSKNKSIYKAVKKFDSQYFQEKRKIGENEQYICQLIRDDMIDEFISHVNQNEIDLSMTIGPSIFETNSFLICKTVSLIEYSAFFGSIQIFKYLYLNGVSFESSLWIFAIHGQCHEIIHILEDNKIEPESIKLCFSESLKCHHNEIANYLLNNYSIKNDFDFAPCISYYNYLFFPKKLDYRSFINLCKHNYLKIVEVLCKLPISMINEKIISKKKFFLI